MPHNDSDAQTLQAALNVLMPIRRQRLIRSERQLRQAENTLKSINARLQQHQTQLQTLRRAGRQQRDALNEKLKGRDQGLDDLKSQLDAERRALHQIELESQRGHEQRQQQHQQQQQVGQARQLVNQNQKAVEKLACLLTLHRESL